MKVIASLALFVVVVGAVHAELAPLLKAKEPVAGSYIIRLKDSFEVYQLADNPILSELGGRVKQRYNRALHGFSAELTNKALQFIRNSGLVEYVEEDGIARKAQLSEYWGVDRCNQRDNSLDNNKDFTVGNQGEGANVFVIDSGIDPDNAEFTERAVAAADFVSRGKQMNGIDCDGHGTHCSGTVGGVNYGVAPKVNILGVRVLNCQGSGYWSEIIDGCEFVINHQAPLKVASMSIGGGVSTSVNEAVQSMIDNNVAVAVAAGNENGDACNSSPAAAENCLTVGASDSTDTRAYFSNYGSCVDIFAPGVDITSVVLNNGVESWSGTSMATPHVAGVLALARVENPTMNAADIMAMVKDSATNGIVNDDMGSENKLLYCP